MSITIPQKKKLSYGWVVVATSFITCTVVFGIQYSFGIFFTSFQEAFGWSRATTSMVMTIHLSVFALCMVPVGWAIDRFNVRMLFSIAAILVGLAMVLCSHISQLWQIYVFYGLLMGVGVSMFGPVIMTIVTHWFTKRRGLALGIASAGVGFGTLVGAPLSHFLIATYGWRDSFTILGVFGGIILLICAQFMRRAPLPVGNDTTTTLPESTLHKKEPYDSKGMPLIQALKTKDILLILTAQIFIGFTVRSVMVHIAPHAIDVGISPSVAALATGTIGGVSILGRVVMGFVQDKIGAHRSMIICLIIQSIAMLILPLIKIDLALFAFAIVFGFTYGGDVPQTPVIIVQSFGMAAMSIIYSSIQTIGNLSGAAGPFLAGYVFDLTGSYTLIFIVAGAGLLIGAFCISRIKPRY